jgi:hypothetical protein
MAARPWRAILALLFLAAGCAAPAPQIKRIVLLAPFESTYREVGYDALYPVKLALADEARPEVQLLSVDDGGSVENSVLRAQALKADPSIILTLVTGPIATDKRVLDALQDIPVVVIGEWSVKPEDGVFVLAAEELAAQVTSRASDIYEAAVLSEATGGEFFGLKSFAALSQDTSNITVLTSAEPASPEFRERLLASDLYVPEPGLLATVAYDAGTLAARVVSEADTRADVLAGLRELNIQGINGEIGFDENGYWTDAPVYEYRYTGDILTPVKP